METTWAGEWVAKIEGLRSSTRQKYPALLAIASSHDDLGFIWKVHFGGRPKKGDPQFRLRRKSKPRARMEPGCSFFSAEKMGVLNGGDGDANNDGAAAT
jgi:hypothetical protein